jgi:hypothetical protein
METELKHIKDFEENVLKSGVHDKAKQYRVQFIKFCIIRSQRLDPLEDAVEAQLGMIVSRRTMQQIEDELKKLDEATVEKMLNWMLKFLPKDTASSTSKVQKTPVAQRKTLWALFYTDK